MPARDLHQLLEQHRDALEALPGVIGTAVGADEVHLYVTPGTDPVGVRTKADRLLDGAPVEVVEMETPEAQAD